MNTTSPDRNERARTKAESELEQLQRLAAQTRETLARLQQDVADAETQLGNIEALQLLEANEQLVLNALRAQTEAETAAMALKEVSRAAALDALTELPNRVLLLDRLTQAIAIAKRRRSRLALLFLDLNNFKQINDTLGHAVGDEVLKVAANCLASSVRAADTVSRHGGDEFLILLADVSHASDAIVVADKVITALGTPSRVGEHVLRLTASIGISIFPDDGDDADTLIDRADVAMYRAKRQGLGRYACYGEALTPEHTKGSLARTLLRQPMASFEAASIEQERRSAQLQEANERLVLAALSAQELLAAAERAQQRQSEFIAELTRELRRPLVPVRSAAALLGRVRADEPLLRRVQAVIEQQVAHMLRLVGNLLDVSQASTGGLALERSDVDMAAIIDQAVDAWRPAMDMRLQRFSVQLPSRALLVHGDPACLAQIVGNLLDNASKYTPDRGEIALSVVVVDEKLVVTVSDSGIGITAEALPHAFEPFVRDTHAIGFNGAGLGIGLTVVQALVQAHGSHVAASSAGSGLGSQFVVTLPLAGAPAVQPG